MIHYISYKKENKLKKTVLTIVSIGLASMLLNGCAGDNYEPQYSSYDNRSQNDREIDGVISQEMNSLSDKNIAELNKLK